MERLLCSYQPWHLTLWRDAWTMAVHRPWIALPKSHEFWLFTMTSDIKGRAAAASKISYHYGGTLLPLPTSLALLPPLHLQQLPPIPMPTPTPTPTPAPTSMPTPMPMPMPTPDRVLLNAGDGTFPTQASSCPAAARQRSQSRRRTWTATATLTCCLGTSLCHRQPSAAQRGRRHLPDEHRTARRQRVHVWRQRTCTQGRLRRTGRRRRPRRTAWEHLS